MMGKTGRMPKRKTLKLLTRSEARAAVKAGKKVVGFFIYEGRTELATCFETEEEMASPILDFKECHAFVLWPEKK